MRHRVLITGLLSAYAVTAPAQPPPLLPEADVAAIANELSGEIAKRNLEGLAQFHRQRGSLGFHSAAERVAELARTYRLSSVEILRFPADGKTYYGTQRSRPAWDASRGELSEITDAASVSLASYAAQPVVLAEDSESADVTADLVDVGEGTHETDYAGKDVAGKIVLTAAQPGAVEALAVGKFGALGIVSYALNQKTAWSGENDNLIRWGHLETFSPIKTFGFMVSLRTARRLQERLKDQKRIRLHAIVAAGQHPGYYEVVTALIPGSDATLKDQEIAFSCHLDHQQPGANDNASGCVTILEVARTLQHLIGAGQLAPPARSLRFIWPPEIEGTATLLNAKPDFAARIKAVVHMDMVGGNLDTKSVFHVTRGPLSLPSFVHDVAWAFADWVNRESYQFAASGTAAYPLTAAEGGREPLRAVYSAYSMGSDHDVYQDSSFGIPAIYMNDWPDRYIHTNGDTPANIDPTKLKRAALIGAASGYILANVTRRDVPSIHRAIGVGKLLRAVTALERQTADEPIQEYEDAVLQSLDTFLAGVSMKAQPRRLDGKDQAFYQRRPQPRGPMTVFGYDYFADHYTSAGVSNPKLLSYQGAWGAGEEYAYEALNFADGRHSAQQITDELSAEYGSVPLAQVVEYLTALKQIGVLE